MQATNWHVSLRCRRHLSWLSPTRSNSTRATSRSFVKGQRLDTRRAGFKPESRQPRSSRPEYDTADAIFRARRLPLLAAGVVALGSGLYCTMMVSSFLRSNQTPNAADPTGRPPGFTRDSAERFDHSLDASEKSMGITSLREKLGQCVAGHVLEVAIGTGRNMAFYDWSTVVGPTSPTATVPSQGPTAGQAPMLSFTGVDVSPEMLSVAAEKLPDAVLDLKKASTSVSRTTLPTSRSSWKVSSYLSGSVRLAQGDIQEVLPLPNPIVSRDTKYDTVVQTFGLCSVADPERVVLNLVDAVKPGTGRIILIEHGQSWLGIVNTLLDWSAPSHYQKYGCWWNRDIIGIIESVAQTDPRLRIVKIERPFITQLGTTVWVELQVEQTKKD